jgi:hypothetical protein
VRADDPLLASHRIAGATVLPAMMALDWLAALARTAWPDAGALAIEDFEVVAGVTLGVGADGGVRLDLAAAAVPGDPERMALTLASADGRLRYRAFARPAPADGARRAPVAAQGRLWTMSPAEAYAGGALFHGPAFQALAALGIEGEAGAEAEVRSSHPSGRALGVDVACLDAGLQAALLWGLPRLGGGSLPTRIGRILTFGEADPEATLRVVLASRTLDARRARHDIAFYAPDGTLLVLMESVEMVAAPALAR